MKPPSPPPSIESARPFAESGNNPVIASMPAAFASAGSRPAVTISGSVKQTAGIVAALTPPRFSGEALGPHSALLRLLVPKHRFSDETADRPNILARCLALTDNLNKGPIKIHRHFLEAPAFRLRAAAHGDEDLVG